MRQLQYIGTFGVAGVFSGTLTNHLTASQLVPIQTFDMLASAGAACLDGPFECFNFYCDPITVELSAM